MRPLLIVASLLPVLLLIGYGVAKTNGSWRNQALWIGFLVGAGMGVLAYFVETLLAGVLAFGVTQTLGRAAFKAFTLAAVPEEIGKYTALLILTVRYVEGRRLQDVLLLSLGVGMGFAGFENMLYLALSQNWQVLAFERAVSAVPAHGIFGLAMGGLVIATVLSPGQRWLGLALALLVPIVLHGAYDALLLVSSAAATAWKFPAVVLVMAGSALLAVGMCNMVLPEAAALDQGSDPQPPRARGRLPKRLSRAAGGFLFLLLAVARFSHYDATVCWLCAFTGVLPLILAADLIITRLRDNDRPAAVTGVASQA